MDKMDAIALIEFQLKEARRIEKSLIRKGHFGLHIQRIGEKIEQLEIELEAERLKQIKHK